MPLTEVPKKFQEVPKVPEYTVDRSVCDLQALFIFCIFFTIIQVCFKIAVR